MKKTIRERKVAALYQWLLNQGTPSRIASMFVHTVSNKVMNLIIQDEGIQIPKE